MGRIVIGGAVIALVLMVYCLVDLTVTDDRRIKRLNRVLWVVIIALLPIVGPLAWLALGKAPVGSVRPQAPDDDPGFTGKRGPRDAETDRRILELEAQLAALDDEIAPGSAQRASDAEDAPAPDDENGQEEHPEAHRDASPPSDDDGGRGIGRG